MHPLLFPETGAGASAKLGHQRLNKARGQHQTLPLRNLGLFRRLLICSTSSASDYVWILLVTLNDTMILVERGNRTLDGWHLPLDTWESLIKAVNSNSAATYVERTVTLIPGISSTNEPRPSQP
jgi:hypothetical protein